LAAGFQSLFRPLQALRGVSTVVSATVVAELGDLRRFKNASRLMSYVGLVPSESSSGSKVQRGSITKTGNPHVRRVLIQAAWSGRLRPAMSVHLKRRSAGLPPEILDTAWRAQRRLHARYGRMRARGKSPQHTVVAMARELAGFIWSIGQQVAA